MCVLNCMHNYWTLYVYMRAFNMYITAQYGYMHICKSYDNLYWVLHISDLVFFLYMYLSGTQPSFDNHHSLR